MAADVTALTVHPGTTAVDSELGAGQPLASRAALPRFSLARRRSRPLIPWEQDMTNVLFAHQLPDASVAWEVGRRGAGRSGQRALAAADRRFES